MMMNLRRMGSTATQLDAERQAREKVQIDLTEQHQKGLAEERAQCVLH